MRYHANRRSSSAFTLVEVMIVLIIIGAISALALPKFTRSVSIAKERRALNNLYLIHSAQLTYLKHNGAYWPPSGPVENLASINTNLSLNILADGDTYTCRFRPAVQNYYECLAQFDNAAYELKLDGRAISEGVNPCCNAGACPLSAVCS